MFLCIKICVGKHTCNAVDSVYTKCISGLPNGLKGLQPRAPKAEGPQDKKNHIEFDRRQAMQCFVCVQCMVIVDFRVSAVYLGQLLSKNLFFLARNWLCKANILVPQMLQNSPTGI